MKWYHYIFAFLTGLFLTNAVPHFVNGISGDAFPTPFASPPGQGLSSATLNIAWALFNIILGYATIRFSKLNFKNDYVQLLFALGVICMSFLLSDSFSDKLN